MEYARLLQVATELNLADSLKNGPLSVEDLAQATGTHAPSLTRFLHALTDIDVFTESEPGYFAHNEQSRLLQSDHPSGLYYMARFHGSAWNWASWQALAYSIRTGKPAFNSVYGTDIWTYLGKEPEDAAVFNEAMTAYTRASSQAVVKGYDFSTVHTVADIGGGQGFLLRSVLQAYPHVRGILVEQAGVIEPARSAFAQACLQDRCTFVAADIFQHIPVQADVFLLKGVLHNWDDTLARQLLQRCRQAMTMESTLIIVEYMLVPGRKNSLATLMDLQMLLEMQEGARERTEDEFRALLSAEGLAMTLLPTERGPLIEARRTA
jgi:hypothetical protein